MLLASLTSPNPSMCSLHSCYCLCWWPQLDNLGALQTWTSSCRASQTCALSVRCSALFMRFALAIRPQNPLLFACHLTNEVVQLNQLRRCLNAKSSLAVSSRVRHTGPTDLLL